MAYLRLDSEHCKTETQTVPTQGNSRLSVSLSISKPRWDELSDLLGQLKNKEGSELRTDFPQGWTIFWKIRDGESRFFVAHPEADQWVATLALSRTHLDAILVQLLNGQATDLSTLETVSRMSNVEVSLILRTPEVG